MTDKELKRLRRDELLEMLLEATRKVEQLEEELAEARQALASREIALQEAGSIAEAALKLNEVFSAADAAAQQYLENIERMEAQARRRCIAIVKRARAASQEAETSPGGLE